MNNETCELNENKNSSVSTLILTFVPSVMFLLFIMISAFDLDQQIPELIRRALYLLAALLSVACCFGSSLRLFRRKRLWAILVGVLLLLFVNGLISLTFGCGMRRCVGMSTTSQSTACGWLMLTGVSVSVMLSSRLAKRAYANPQHPLCGMFCG
ncbi:MAG: hypothetical protein DME26_07780 [Verrucomicrobia bacterium]|nr:MAG: hypothetical protein DME26_07780 [Verrucomicrobiota bacterium]